MVRALVVSSFEFLIQGEDKSPLPLCQAGSRLSMDGLLIYFQCDSLGLVLSRKKLLLNLGLRLIVSTNL